MSVRQVEDSIQGLIEDDWQGLLIDDIVYGLLAMSVRVVAATERVPVDEAISRVGMRLRGAAT